MSRWRRSDPSGADPDPTRPGSAHDPDPTEQMIVPERSWQTGDSATRALNLPGDPASGPDQAEGRAEGRAEGTDDTDGLDDTEDTDSATDWWTATADGFSYPDEPATEVVAGPATEPSAEPATEPTGGRTAVTGPWPVDARARSVQRASAREEILGRVRAAIGGRPAPEGDVPRAYRRSLGLGREDVVSLFADRVADYKATVWPIMREQLAATIAVCLVERGIRRIAVPMDLPTSWLPQYVQVQVDHGELTGADLDSVDGVITGCALGIAETGTIVLDGGRLQGRRMLSLVPDYHLCVVDTLDVVGTLPEALERLDPSRPLTFISGPSATSDIELDRVEGVHGPRTLDVLLTG